MNVPGTHLESLNEVVFAVQENGSLVGAHIDVTRLCTRLVPS
jgi:hypothetical protein